MKVNVELIYKDGTKKAITLEKMRGKGTRILDAVDNAIQKRTDLGDWDRWNLVSIEDEG